MTTVVLRILSALKLTEVTIDPATGVIVNTTNLTILNFFLLRFGPMSEKRLVQVLICSQVRCAELFKYLGGIMLTTPSLQGRREHSCLFY